MYISKNETVSLRLVSANEVIIPLEKILPRDYYIETVIITNSPTKAQKFLSCKQIKTESSLPKTCLFLANHSKLKLPKLPI